MFVKPESQERSQIPDSLPNRTLSMLRRIEFPKDKIVQVINQLDINKAYGCYESSIHMLKSCAFECSLPLKMHYDMSIETGRYPALWKKANFIPVHIKGDRKKTNYRPISLLPICSKIFEKVIIDQIYNHLSENDLFLFINLVFGQKTLP